MAGGSAQREYERRSARELARKQQRVDEDAEWRRSLRAERPILGKVVTALTPKPEIGPESHATRAWKSGAEGERRVAEVLTDLDGVQVLHDRLVPGKTANIDHIAVTPAGVWVIDAKRYAGKVEARDVGGLFRTDVRLYVNNRDRTKLVSGVLGQVNVVSAVLSENFPEVAVRGVLCFVGADWGFVMRQKNVRDVTVLWPNRLPELTTAPGPHAEKVPAIADHLRNRLRPGRTS